MKKNILTVVVLALCLVNVVLTATIVFTVLPTSRKTDALVSEVASIIKLEVSAGSDPNFDLSSQVPYTVIPASPIMANLKNSADNTPHMAKMDSMTIYLNKNSKDYETYSTKITEKNYDAKIIEIVSSSLAALTVEQLKENQNLLKTQVLEEIKKYMASTDLIVDISFTNLLFT